MAKSWDPSLSLGVPEIDGQHQELLRRFDALLSALRDDGAPERAARLLDFVDRYVVEHFEAEARLMWACAYPHTNAHLAEHHRFTASIKALRRDLEAHGPSWSLAVQVISELGGWFRQHVEQTDQRLAAYLRLDQPRAAP